MIKAGIFFLPLNQIHKAALITTSRIISGQNNGDIPSTNPILENNKYVATMKENKVAAQGMPNRHGVMSTTLLGS